MNPKYHKESKPFYLGTCQNLNGLILDDHPVTCIGYKMMLEAACLQKEIPELRMAMTHTLKQAYELIHEKGSQGLYYDFVFLDIRLPPYPQENMFSGEDIGKLLRKVSRQTKILVFTSLQNPYRLRSILKSLNPEALVLKTEVCDKKLVTALTKALNGIPYYSPSILKIIKNQLITDNEITPPERKFLYLLSTGVQSKEIPKHLPWSVSKVEKQKRILKEKLGVEEKSSWSLIHKAKELGII
ncbi:MAG: hypothetical protein AAFU57_10950 [Bacteroidota bacterium]